MKVNFKNSVEVIALVLMALYGGWMIRGISIPMNNGKHLIYPDISKTGIEVLDEDATFNTIDSILLQAVLYAKADGHFPEFHLIEIPIGASIRQGNILDQYGREIHYAITNNVLEVRSAGRDNCFETDDDIIGVVSLDETGRHIFGKNGTFAYEVEQ